MRINAPVEEVISSCERSGLTEEHHFVIEGRVMDRAELRIILVLVWPITCTDVCMPSKPIATGGEITSI